MILGSPRREGFKEKLLAKERRVGEAQIAGTDFQLTSVHEYEGSKLSSQTALGYLIEVEGRPVAAVDLLDWSPAVRIRNDLDASQLNAAIIAALSLAVLRDPANSALED